MAAPSPPPTRITLIGAGTIGLSFAALYLDRPPKSNPIIITIHDTRPDIEDYILKILPSYLTNTGEPHASSNQDLVTKYLSNGLLNIDSDLPSAVARASIIQEQGPENLAFKASLWPEIETHCPPACLLWSSTSGIPASSQSSNMKDPTRLLVVHPWNPPHVFPLLEIVPTPRTNPEMVDRTLSFLRSIDRIPILLRKETTGFVANRLAFALLREAIHLVSSGVASPQDVDMIVQNSMGPRWAIAGPFKSYQAGGGEAGLEGFFKNIGGTVQDCWDDAGRVNVGEGGWEEDLFRQTKEAYGVVDTGKRDELSRRVLDAAKEDSIG